MNPQQSATPRAQDVKVDRSGDASEKELASITVASRIPEFWADQTRLWFVRFEATVENQKLSDAAKQDLVITKLSKTAIEQVSDLLLAPPETRKYQTLKERLLEVFEESESRRLQKLIGEMELGDQRPSHLLRRMRELARERVPDETLKLMWQSHLPTSVRAVLTVTDSKSLDVLATIADKVMESTGETSSSVSEVKAEKAQKKPAEQRTDITSDISKIRGELAKINLRLAGLERSRARGRRDSSGSRGSRPTSVGDRKSDKWLCFYHYRYKEKATKCVKPCNWSNGTEKSAGN